MSSSPLPGTVVVMRRAVVKIHLWVGLGIGLIWLIQGLTGAILVFHRELSRSGLEPAPSVTPLPLDTLVASASRGAGGLPIVRLSVADDRRDLIHAYYPDPDDASRLRILVLDASTGQTLAHGEDRPRTPFAGSAPRWIFLLHQELLSGSFGQFFIGITGLFLLSTVTVGLWLAWPPRRGWKAVFAWRRWSRLQHKLYGWHRAAGLVAGVLLVTSAASGAYLALDTWINPELNRLVAYQPMYHAHPVERLPADMISPREALDRAQAIFPAGRWVRLYLPTAEEPRYRVQFYQQGEMRQWLGKSSVSLNASGRIVDVYDALDAPLANRILDAAYPLHNGEIIGWTGRIVTLLIGLTLAGMVVTGVCSWLEKRRRKTVAKQATYAVWRRGFAIKLAGAGPTSNGAQGAASKLRSVFPARGAPP